MPLPPLHLTPRDTEMLHYIALRRGLTAPQASTVCFWAAQKRWKEKGHTNCSHRLKLMAEHGLVDIVEQPTTSAEGRKHYVYTITRKGARALADQQSIALGDLPYRTLDKSQGMLFLKHLIGVNDIWAALVYATAVSRQPHFTLASWADDAELKSTHAHDKMHWFWPSGKQEKNAVLVPDGYAHITRDDDGKPAHVFIEFDRGTQQASSSAEYNTSFERKIRNYEAYYASGLYTNRYHAKGLRVLIITSSWTRLAHLKKIAENVVQDAKMKHRYWFSVKEVVTPLTILTESIWQQSWREGMHPLLQKEAPT